VPGPYEEPGKFAPHNYSRLHLLEAIRSLALGTSSVIGWRPRRARSSGGGCSGVRLAALDETHPGQTKEMQTYTLGETVRVELDLRDESGVLTVSATFYETESGYGFSMRGEGEGRTEVKMVLTQEVTDKTLRGEYRCKNVTVYDTYYNHKTFAPNIRFRIENVPGDHEGPELVGWRVTK
jgi:hypothetical protein